MPSIRSALRLVLVLAVIALVPLALSRLNPRPPAQTPRITSTPATPVASSSVPYPPAVLGYEPPPEVASYLRAVELRAAAAEGDPKPASIQVVVTTGAQARRAEPVAGRPAASFVVYLVVMRGDFALSGVDPHATALAAGHYASAIFEGATLRLLGTGISDRPPAIPLSRLGRVLDLLLRPAPS